MTEIGKTVSPSVTGSCKLVYQKVTELVPDMNDQASQNCPQQSLGELSVFIPVNSLKEINYLAQQAG